MEQLTFGWTDYTLFGGLLGVSLLIGIYFGFFSKQDSAAEYLFGGKSMAYVPVATSILASLLSGITFLGIPTEVYFHGAEFVNTAIPAILNSLISAYIFMPTFYHLQLASSYEYLELRFSRLIRLLASGLYVVSLLLYIPLVVYVPALAFSQVTGYSIHTITPVFSIVCITYTTMGGVKAVVWTDTIQFVFTIGGLITVLTIGVNAVGGLSEVWRINKEGKRLDIFDLNPNPFERNTFWGMTVGSLFLYLSRIAVGQKFIQRFLSIKEEVDIKKALFLMAGGWVVLQLCCVLTGLIVYAKYHDCDPLTANFIKRSDQTLPFYVMDVAGHVHGLPGVFLAGLVSSALSTMSASLNSLSGIIYEDFVDRWIPDSPNRDSKAANIMKIMVVIIGLVTIGLIFIIEKLGTVFEMAYGLNSATEGPLLGLFILAMMVPWVGKKGAITGACVGLTFMVWLVGGTQWHVVHKRIRNPSLPVSVENCPYPLNETVQEQAATPLPPLAPEEEPMILFQIAILYFTLIGSVITVAVGCAVSWFLSETDDVANVNPDHVSPVIRQLV
ncbi:unnamed protein product [Trichogramma brassicae]|uniref:Sodium-coupled monocarboxylate transporter 1 n=1 Tax=Trichogramma brassicae TaxID=86971 RepID=A0A6H5IWY3_9HYME|nr:unnamed protein product [Trichogramma brassicae]